MLHFRLAVRGFSSFGRRTPLKAEQPGCNSERSFSLVLTRCQASRLRRSTVAVLKERPSHTGALTDDLEVQQRRPLAAIEIVYRSPKSLRRILIVLDRKRIIDVPAPVLFLKTSTTALLVLQLRKMVCCNSLIYGCFQGVTDDHRSNPFVRSATGGFLERV
jgi:hypothetical protein